MVWRPHWVSLATAFTITSKNREMITPILFLSGEKTYNSLDHFDHYPYVSGTF